MARVRSAALENQPTSEGSAKLWERIDDLANRKGVTTQELATAAGVTWTAAKRWRKPKEKQGSVPKGAQLPAIARVLGVTLDELMQSFDGHEPPYDSWSAFKGTATYERLSERQRTLVSSHPWDEDEEPSLGSWLALAEAHLAARRAAS